MKRVAQLCVRVYTYGEGREGFWGSGHGSSEAREGLGQRGSTHCISGRAKPQHGGRAYGLTVETFIGKQTRCV